MNSEVAISVKNLTKTYRLFGQPGERIKQFFSLGLKQYHKGFTALDDVSFEIKKGETVGIIGRNGSGKSTLLQLICSILKPTSGSITVNGRITALLELGAGFNPEFTGRENVYFQGAVLGFSKAQMDERFCGIAAFADIGEFLDQPVRTYSSGMYVRLAYAVQAMSNPDILIVDEALGVGDFFFQQKCYSHIRTLCENGVTVLFVSHDTNTIRDLCSRAIYLKNGRINFSGETLLAMRHYLAEKNTAIIPSVFSATEDDENTSEDLAVILCESVWSAPKKITEINYGKLIAVAFYDAEDRPATSFRLGSTMRLKVIYKPSLNMPTHVTIEMRNKYNQVVTSVGSSRIGLLPPKCQQDELMVYSMSLDLCLEVGIYSVLVNLGSLVGPNIGLNIDSSPLLGPISIQWDYENDIAPFLGMVGLPATGEFAKVVVESSKI